MSLINLFLFVYLNSYPNASASESIIHILHMDFTGSRLNTKIIGMISAILQKKNKIHAKAVRRQFTNNKPTKFSE